MAAEYIFVWDTEERTYPERYRVEEPGATGPNEEVTGTVSADDVEALMTDLRARFPAPRYDVNGQFGTRWTTVARNYPSMR